MFVRALKHTINRHFNYVSDTNPPNCMYGQHFHQSRDQLGMVANPPCMVTHIARVWITRIRLRILLVVSSAGKMIISLSAFAIWSRETGSAVPSRVNLLISIFRLNLVLTYGIPPEFRGGVHFFFLTAIRHRVIPEFIGSLNCLPMAFTAESPPAQGQ